MSKQLKAASFAAIIMSAFAAVMASDATFATGVVAAATQISTTATARRAVLPVDTTVLTPEITDTTVVNPDAPANAAAPAFTTPSVSMPAPGHAASLAELVADQAMPASLDDETRCLAGAVYFESKGESLAGQLAVARVVINRRDSGRFASSLCGVVYQPSQFSFVRGHGMPAIPVASRDWREAVAIAQIAMNDSWDSVAEGALFFHASRVSPGWKRQRLAMIDNHIFYR